MKAMILAAGRGERMRPLTDETPKPLLRAGGRALIEYHIEKLVAAGITELVVNHAHLGERIVEALGSGGRFGARIQYAPEPEGALETGGGIARALPLLEDHPFAVVNADVWSDFPYERLPAAPGGDAWLVLVDNPSHHPDGDFALRDGQVVLDGGPRRTFAGIAVYRPEFFRDAPRGRFALGPWLRRAVVAGRVQGEHYRGRWMDVGTPERLRELDRLLGGGGGRGP